MITGELKTKIDAVWNDFWSGGISNPLEVMEQLTLLLFIKGLDETETRAERKATRTGEPIENPTFPDGIYTPEGKTTGRPYADLRWDRLKNLPAKEMFEVVEDYVFPFLQERTAQSTHGKHMKGARFTIPTPGLLQKAVDGLDAIPMEDRDTKGDVYEYMLSKIATAGQNGQFRTPRHIIQLMVEMTAPTPGDTICDPASGTCGFLVAAGEYLRDRHPDMLTDAAQRTHFHNSLFHGYDFDNQMLRIGSMNLQLHGVENPAISYRDALAQDHAADIEAYSLILANPPFSGSLDYEAAAQDLLQLVKTKKTELLFVALFLRMLKPGGRAAVIVPLGVLEAESQAHSTIRRTLVEDNRLEGVIALPHWVFKPYASVATAILIFGRSDTTKRVWFYRVDDDGFLNDANKTPSLASELPEVSALWGNRNAPSYEPVVGKHRFVNRREIEEAGFDLCPAVYLREYEYPKDVPLVRLDSLFDVTKGSVPASEAVEGGKYPFITTATTLRSHDSWQFEGEGIGIPLVSATGHGHASLKSIHYVNGRFAAATITAVLMPRPGTEVHVPYFFHYLRALKDELLVPLLRGAANKSMNASRLGRLMVPQPPVPVQRAAVSDLAASEEELARALQVLGEREAQWAAQLAVFRSQL